jgi:glutaminyl-peptide cyclotransferase
MPPTPASTPARRNPHLIAEVGASIVVGVLGALGGALASCGSPASSEAPAVTAIAGGVEVLATLPHDPQAFTQGLELRSGVLYEATGLVGESWVGYGAAGEEPRRRADLEEALFGEGITLHGRSLWQLTWQNGVAIERDADTLAEIQRVAVDREGWGICSDGSRLVTSDGTATLVFRDAKTFAPKSQLEVTRDGRPLRELNELECPQNGAAAGQILANVWRTNEIVRIDPTSGEVTATYDMSGLRELLPKPDAPDMDVLNGIAHIDGDRYLVTGKKWPTLFEVRLP